MRRRWAALAVGGALCGLPAAAEEVRTLWLLSEGGAPVPAARVVFAGGPDGPRFRVEWDAARFRPLPAGGGVLPCLPGPEEVWCRLPAPDRGPVTAEAIAAALAGLRRPAAEPGHPGRPVAWTVAFRRGRWQGRITEPGSDGAEEPWISAFAIE